MDSRPEKPEITETGHLTSEDFKKKYPAVPRHDRKFNEDDPAVFGTQLAEKTIRRIQELLSKNRGTSSDAPAHS